MNFLILSNFSLFCYIIGLVSKKFYISTPIYYVNDKPHIGHLCTTLAADVLARHHRLIGDDVFFLTGTDEHGAKIAKAAKENKKTPADYCDQLAKDFEQNWKKLNLSYDFFIRTTDPRHKKAVSEFIQNIYDSGDIYKAKYEGLYCVGCEKFLTDSDLVDGKCPYHSNQKPQKQSEENYFFRLSKYQEKIEKVLMDPKYENYYEIFPENKKREILNKVKEGLRDISISRANVDWGIPIPWDKKQTIYVWFDALLNYYTVTRFLKNKKKFWPADLHIVGKEISWFHAVIWPVMLLAAGEKIPKKLFVHSFYISGGQKMSKSLGNVISPKDLTSNFGLEGTRYLIASTFPGADDSDITMEFLKEKYNADLANGLGNLVQRVSKLCEKVDIKYNFHKNYNNYKNYDLFLKNYKFNEALGLVWKKVSELDKYVNDTKPWKKKGIELEKILQKPVNEILEISFLLKPFLPETAEKIEKIFTANQIKAPKNPLFPRFK